MNKANTLLDLKDLGIWKIWASKRAGHLKDLGTYCFTANWMKSHQTLYDNPFAVLGPKLWNSIPYKLNSSDRFEVFTSRLAAFLLTVPKAMFIVPPNSNSFLAWRVQQRCGRSRMSAAWLRLSRTLHR